MQLNTKFEKINDILTHISFGIWAVMALWFFQERLYSDASFFLAKVIHYEGFWVELYRFLRICSQWLPLLCIKLGCSMKTILLAHSVGHVVFFYAMFLIGRYALGNRQIGWLLLATQTVGILHGFCEPGFELYYASALLAIFSILLHKNDFSIKNNVFLFLLIVAMVINYQLIPFMIGGVLLLHFSKYQFQYWKVYALVFGSILVSFILKKSLPVSTYEIEKMEQFILNLTTRTYSWDEYIRPLFSFYIEYYKELWAIAILTVVLYIKEKKYLVAIGYLFFLLITQYIVALTYPSLDHSRYQEQCYFPLIFVACFPFIMDIQERAQNKMKWALMVGTFVLIVYRFFAISVAIEPFSNRVNYMHRVIEAAQKIEGNKFIAHEEWWNPTFGGMSFTIGTEAMLLSALNKNRKTIQIIRDSEWVWEDSVNIKTLQDTNLYMNTYRSFYDRTDSIYQHKDANPRFFNFPAGKYRFLNGQVPRLDSTAQFKGTMSIKTFPASKYKKQTQDNILIHITTNKQPINSEQIKLSYHWWKDGKVVAWDNIRTPLEFDLQASSDYYQYVLVNLPTEAGQYELQIDAVDDGGLGWLGSEARVPVKVK